MLRRPANAGASTLPAVIGATALARTDNKRAHEPGVGGNRDSRAALLLMASVT